MIRSEKDFSQKQNHSQAFGIQETPRLKINFWSVVWSLVWLLLIVMFLLRIFVYQQVNVVGSSMEPNYYTNEKLLVNRQNKEFLRGQVVAAYSDQEQAKNAGFFTPYDPATKFFLKRIIGLPGESVQIVDGTVIIYSSQFPEGRVLVEPYLPASTIKKEQIIKDTYPKTKIPESSYFLLGDNRTNSHDSRNPSVGMFADYAIFGQETVRYWPIAKAEVFELPEYQYIEISQELRSKF